MRKFAIVANSAKDNSVESSEELIRIIEKNGCTCTACLISQGETDPDSSFLFTDPALVPSDTEVILSLGGDGTFIHAAKDLISLQLPVFGVNIGTLGYMTEVGVDGFEGALQSMINGSFQIEDRMLLNCDFISGGEIVHRGLAFNDIVLQRALDAGIAQYEVSVNGQYLNTYSADGMIISTPTGSTGYSLSAGGPVVLPIAQITLVTPICAHTLNSRTIVLPAEVQIDIVGRTHSKGRSHDIFVTIDGEQGIKLGEDGSICASKAKGVAKTLRINRMSFIEQLGKKMRY